MSSGGASEDAHEAQFHATQKLSFTIMRSFTELSPIPLPYSPPSAEELARWRTTLTEIEAPSDYTKMFESNNVNRYIKIPYTEAGLEQLRNERDEYMASQESEEASQHQE